MVLPHQTKQRGELVGSKSQVGRERNWRQPELRRRFVSIDVNVRLIAATNKSLVQSMKEGAFRVDLFYRLKVFSIFIPPLRERRSDLPLLAEYIINKVSGQIGQSPKDISKKAMAQLMKYHWPGNVRELENNLHTAMVMS